MKASGIRSLARTTVVSMERIPAMRTSWLECNVLPSRMSPIALFIIADQAMQRPVPVVLDVVSPLVCGGMVRLEELQASQPCNVVASLLVQFQHCPRFPRYANAPMPVDVELSVEVSLFDGHGLHIISKESGGSCIR